MPGKLSTIVVAVLSVLAAAAPAGPAQAAPAGSAQAAGSDRAPQSDRAWEPEGVHTARQLPNDEGLGYYEYLPPGYAKGEPWPLVFFLHGSGEKGNGRLPQLDRVIKQGPSERIKVGRHIAAVVISPQLPSDERKWRPEVTAPFVAKIRAKYNVDQARVYITGLSLGGEGTWLYALAHRDTIAAIVPICGPGESGPQFATLAGLPTWAYHNIGDKSVKSELTRSKLKVITGVDPEPSRPKGALHTGGFDPTTRTWKWRPGHDLPDRDVVYSAKDSTSHNAWRQAYDNDAVWSWLFSHKR